MTTICTAQAFHPDNNVSIFAPQPGLYECVRELTADIDGNHGIENLQTSTVRELLHEAERTPRQFALEYIHTNTEPSIVVFTATYFDYIAPDNFTPHNMRGVWRQNDTCLGEYRLDLTTVSGAFFVTYLIQEWSV